MNRVRDTHPKDGDVKQAPLVSGPTAKPERPKDSTQGVTMTNSPTNQGTPSVTETMIEAGMCAIMEYPVGGELDVRQAVIDAYVAMQSSAPQHTGLTDVKRLLREARSYVEQAGLRHHDVSGLLAEIDAALLVSDRSGVEREALEKIAAIGHGWRAGSDDRLMWQEMLCVARNAMARAALDTSTINEKEG